MSPSPQSLLLGLVLNCVIVTFLLLVSNPSPADGSKILIIIPLTTVSEKNTYIPLASALGNRGHNVTVAARFKSTYESKNVNEVLTLDFPGYFELFSDPLVMRKAGWKLMINMEYDYNVEGCERLFQNPNFQNIINDKFDLIITNNWFHQCVMGVIHMQETPFIMVSTMPMASYTQQKTGSRNPTSFVPDALASTRDDMSFSERLFNTLFDNYMSWYTENYISPALSNVYKEHLGSHLPDASDIERNVSLIFSNTHISSTSPRPMLPDIVEIGGLHCRPPKPLPKDIDEYLSGSGENGFIFFSLGSVIKGKNMPEEWRKIFLNVFSRLKLRVLWKWESETMEGLPPNVKLGKWLPQQDILGHPKIRLFITHGGMYSTQEATYHGVPTLCMPIFVDQNMNAHHIEKNGFGKAFEVLEITEENFEKAIQELVENKTYYENAKRQSRRFLDQPQTPIERAVFWTEYVIRHDGAHHLRSAARNLNFIQYHSLDVLGVIALTLILTIVIAFTILRKLLGFICKKICGQSGATNQGQKKNQ